MKKQDITPVLTEDVDEEVLKRMPLLFRILREAYAKQTMRNLFLALSTKTSIAVLLYHCFDV